MPAMVSAVEPRKVRCPRCFSLLVEPSGISVYQCGVCGNRLQAKNTLASRTGGAHADRTFTEKKVRGFPTSSVGINHSSQPNSIDRGSERASDLSVELPKNLATVDEYLALGREPDLDRSPENGSLVEDRSSRNAAKSSSSDILRAVNDDNQTWSSKEDCAVAVEEIVSVVPEQLMTTDLLASKFDLVGPSGIIGPPISEERGTTEMDEGSEAKEKIDENLVVVAEDINQQRTECKASSPMDCEDLSNVSVETIQRSANESADLVEVTCPQLAAVIEENFRPSAHMDFEHSVDFIVETSQQHDSIKYEVDVKEGKSQPLPDFNLSLAKDCDQAEIIDDIQEGASVLAVDSCQSQQLPEVKLSSPKDCDQTGIHREATSVLFVQSQQLPDYKLSCPMNCDQTEIILDCQEATSVLAPHSRESHEFIPDTHSDEVLCGNQATSHDDSERCSAEGVTVTAGSLGRDSNLEDLFKKSVLNTEESGSVEKLANGGQCLCANLTVSVVDSIPLTDYHSSCSESPIVQYSGREPKVQDDQSESHQARPQPEISMSSRIFHSHSETGMTYKRDRPPFDTSAEYSISMKGSEGATWFAYQHAERNVEDHNDSCQSAQTTDYPDQRASQGRKPASNQQFQDNASYSAQEHSFGHPKHGFQQSLPQIRQPHKGFTATSHGSSLPAAAHPLPLQPPPETTKMPPSAYENPFVCCFHHSVYPVCKICVQYFHLQHHPMLHGMLPHHCAFCFPQSVYAATIPGHFLYPHWLPFCGSHLDPQHSYSELTSYQTGAPQGIVHSQGSEFSDKSEGHLSQKRKCYPPLPREGAAPYVLCRHCHQLLQVPSYLSPNSGCVQKLRCGACREVSKFSIGQPELGNTGQNSLGKGFRPSTADPLVARAHSASNTVFSAAEENVAMDRRKTPLVAYQLASAYGRHLEGSTVSKMEVKMSSAQEYSKEKLQNNGRYLPSRTLQQGNDWLLQTHATGSTIPPVHSLDYSATFQRGGNSPSDPTLREQQVLLRNRSLNSESHPFPSSLKAGEIGLVTHIPHMVATGNKSSADFRDAGPGGRQQLKGGSSESSNLVEGLGSLKSRHSDSEFDIQAALAVPGSPLHEHFGYRSPYELLERQELNVPWRSIHERMKESNHLSRSRGSNGSAARSPVQGFPTYKTFRKGSADFGQRTEQGDYPQYDGSDIQLEGQPPSAKESSHEKETAQGVVEGKEEIGKGAGKGNSSFAGFLKRSLKEFAKGNSYFQRKPIIEELNYPVSRDFAANSTRGLVNGGELHQRDLQILTHSRLPTMPGEPYSIEINGTVVDRASDKQIQNLGKRASKLEKTG